MNKRTNTNRVVLIAICALMSLSTIATQAQQETGATSERPIRWQHTAPIEIPADAAGKWTDSILTPEVFDGARYDLHDLRVYSNSGAEVQYALRVLSERSERRPLEARKFNTTEGPDQSSELSLDLGEEKLEHNAVELHLPGQNYRRLLKVEGSDDGEQWRLLQEQPVVDFRRGTTVLVDQTIEYPLSRHRYVRIKLFRDPLVDREAVLIDDVKVLRTVEVPGELLTLDAKVGEREAVPTGRGPGSRWVCQLGGDQIPVSSIQVNIAGTEFVRNFRIEAGGPEGSDTDFRTIATGVWRRRAGEPIKPLRSEFPEARAARLRIIVTDNRNPPLQIEQVQFSADARQIVIEPLPQGSSYQLYFGNPDAEDPMYDRARNLPQQMTPEPIRGTLGARTQNPIFEPEPLPLTERWPWLIYVVLSFACVVLAAIALSLSRAAIAAHDSAEAVAS